MLCLNSHFFKRRPRREYLYDNDSTRRCSFFSRLKQLLIATLLILLGVVLGMFIMSINNPVHAAASNLNADYVSMDDISEGSLLLKTNNRNQYLQIPLLNTRVDIDISGMVVRSHVKQRFTNNSPNWVEAVYVFPLPENAAVDFMRMHIGEHVIEAKIREKQQAIKIYQQAKQQGKKTALLEQQRANMFTSSVANIGPGESITIEIEYQQALQYEQGSFSLRFPMAITPRYIPGTPLQQQLSIKGSGWANNTDQVPDASFITPPVNNKPHKINPLSLNIKLNPGFPVDKISSSYHAITQQEMPDGHIAIQLAAGTVPSEHDFELSWTPDISHAPKAALFSEKINNDYFHLLMVLPPDNNAQNEQAFARDVIFVIDTSGSMYGTSMQQAKQSLLMALERLRLHDRFNIIQFNSITGQLFSVSSSATFENIQIAKQYVQQLQANGGTEMAPALNMALTQTTDNNYVRQVIFLTDGSVGNETALFNIIQNNLAQSRLFTVGIGSAPNSYFMRKAAQFGRGSFTYIGDINEVNKKMTVLFKKLENPLMTNLSIDFYNDSLKKIQAEIWPERITDLYSGEAIVLSIKTDQPLHKVRLKGNRALAPWQATLNLNQGINSPGTGRYWARNKIESLMDRQYSAANKTQLREEITDIALKHHLVSKYTSLVAVDTRPSRPLEKALNKQAVAVNLPQGQIRPGQINKVPQQTFGRLAQTATPAAQQLILGCSLLLLALISHLIFSRRLKFRIL
ncbi:Inter-alpha-trypsin inhibitor domain protein [hydrothermal vent metagenome]|uniref:Inter-alpha-trypsin inhibitor domain protein n=1 Tax=hydrothermal vent metagenome TaxID=652676 RepID=A0A3B0YP82_9ZZZZ